jgi:glyoxylase-like metal-dependent hydrolase (beta-lactamase superfamily II)
VTGTWTIDGVRYATRPHVKSEFMYQYALYGEPDVPQALDYWFYVLRDGDRTIVVDTGFDAELGRSRGRTVLADPAPILASLAADTLVLTHLHYDHIGNIPAVGQVRIVMPATELAFWRSPVAAETLFSAHTDPAGLEAIEAADRAGRVDTFTASSVVAPGIVAFEVGGHSAGQIVLLVQTSTGPVVLCSDAVHLYEELELRRPFMIVSDLPAAFAAFDFINDLGTAVGAIAVPGHDPLTAARFGPGDLHDLAVRICP